MTIRRPVIFRAPGADPLPWEAAAGREAEVVEIGAEPSGDARAALRNATAALVDGRIPDPVGLAQRIRTLDPLIQLVLVVDDGARARLERTILFTPGLGEVWMTAPAALDAEMVERAGEVTAQRRSYRATHRRIEHDLSAIEPYVPRRALISDAFLAALLAALPDPLFSIDEEGRVLTWNAAAEQGLGFTRERAIGAPLHELITVRDPAALDRLLADASAAQGVLRSEILFEGREGQARIAEVAVVRVAAEGHSVRALLLHDVTEERRLHDEMEGQARELQIQSDELQNQAARLEEAQIELEVANDELQRANTALAREAAEAQRARESAEAARREAEAASRAKSEFLATMSHEIRTPINAIIGYTDLLGLEIAGPVNPKQAAQLQRVRSSSQHLLMLIEDILDLAKVEAGRLEVAHEPASARAAIDAAIDLIGPQAAEKGVALRDDSSTGEDFEYVGDEDRVRQIVLNLLSNAVKFTPAGGEVRVTCGTSTESHAAADPRAGDEWLFIRVEDTGIGIETDEIERIFHPFVQAEGGLTRTKGGTGLGLTISRQLALLMGGDLTATSEVGVGSVFTLWLPTEPVVEPPLEQALVEDDSHHATARLGDAVLEGLPGIVRAFATRVGRDPQVPMAASISRCTLEDHVFSFLADIAQSLRIVSEAGEDRTNLLRDGTEIQRVVSELHGAQRARLGWTEAALLREFEILRDEVRAAAWNVGLPAAETADALQTLDRTLEHAERASLRGLRRTHAIRG